MNSRVCSALISFCLHLLLFYGTSALEEKFPAAKGFLGYRAISTLRKYCDCKTSYSCTCCQTVVILYTKAERNLCVNFTYQRNGLNIDVTLNSDTLRARTVTDYKPLKFCTTIPGCYFSSVCVNVLELNKFPRYHASHINFHPKNRDFYRPFCFSNFAARSITICLRLDIFSKKRLWKLNYDCVSVSTELPAMPNNGTEPTTNTTKEMGGMSTTMNNTMTTAMPSSQMTMTTAMPSSQMTMTTEMPSSQMPTTTMMATMTMTTMTTVMAETEETTTNSDVEVITVPGSEATTVVDID